MWQLKTGPIWQPKFDNIHRKYVCHVSDTSALPSEVVFLWAFSRPKPLEIEKKLPWCGLPRHPWTSPKSIKSRTSSLEFSHKKTPPLWQRSSPSGSQIAQNRWLWRFTLLPVLPTIPGVVQILLKSKISSLEFSHKETPPLWQGFLPGGNKLLKIVDFSDFPSSQSSRPSLE